MGDGLARLEIGYQFADRMYSLSYISFYFIIVSMAIDASVPLGENSFGACTGVKTVSHVYPLGSKGKEARRKSSGP